MAPWRLAVGVLAAALLGSLIATDPISGDLVGSALDGTILTLVTMLVVDLRIDGSALRSGSWRVIPVALILNFAVLPFVGFGIAQFILFDRPALALGATIYFMAPCTDWFLGFTKLARGDTALGTALLPINLIVQLLLYPHFLTLFSRGEAVTGQVEVAGVILQWFALPVAFGLLIRALLFLLRDRPIARAARARSGRIVSGLVLVIVVEVFAANAGVIVDAPGAFASVLLAAMIFFVVAYALASVTGRLTRLGAPAEALLAMTTSARNAPLMIALTALILPDQPQTIAAIAIGMLVEFPHLAIIRMLLLRKARHGAGRGQQRHILATSREGERTPTG